MAELILTSDWSPNLRVLEIGCGSGLVGVAALLKGLNVTFADIVPEAANLAVENARLNGFPNTPAILFDWRQPPQLSFDLIMANEVLYAPALHEPLLTTLEAMLATNGQCWIGDPGRATAKDFIHLAHDRGFSISFRNSTGRPGIMPSAGAFQVLVLSRSIEEAQHRTY
jgi:predicted nicotinamide N-methyase